MNFLHVHHSGANTKYYIDLLSYINKEPSYGVSISRSSLREFIDKGVPKGTDVLSYQTFPDEHNPKKFNPEVIEKSDLQFHTFEGRKILVDTYDCGDKDAFSRMVSSTVLPRVKCYPTKWFLDNYNVILCSTVSANPGVFPDEYDRTIPISCKFGEKGDNFYGHPIRNTVKKYIQESFVGMVDCTWVERSNVKKGSNPNYFDELRRTKIVIGAPGWGRHNGSYWGALKAGAMLFAHRSLNEIKLFPHADIIDGEDYVSYDLFDFKIKLDRILQQPDEIERIRNNGRRKYAEGLDYKKSADQLIKHLKGG